MQWCRLHLLSCPMLACCYRNRSWGPDVGADVGGVSESSTRIRIEKRGEAVTRNKTFTQAGRPQHRETREAACLASRSLMAKATIRDARRFAEAEEAIRARLRYTPRCASSLCLGHLHRPARWESAETAFACRLVGPSKRARWRQRGFGSTRRGRITPKLSSAKASRRRALQLQPKNAVACTVWFGFQSTRSFTNNRTRLSRALSLTLSLPLPTSTGTVLKRLGLSEGRAALPPAIILSKSGHVIVPNHCKANTWEQAGPVLNSPLHVRSNPTRCSRGRMRSS